MYMFYKDSFVFMAKGAFTRNRPKQDRKRVRFVFFSSSEMGMKNITNTLSSFLVLFGVNAP